jgi:hypothetical protein
METKKNTKLRIVLGRLQRKKTKTITNRILDWWFSSASPEDEFSTKTVELLDKLPFAKFVRMLSGADTSPD